MAAGWVGGWVGEMGRGGVVCVLEGGGTGRGVVVMVEEGKTNTVENMVSCMCARPGWRREGAGGGGGGRRGGGDGVYCSLCFPWQANRTK